MENSIGFIRTIEDAKAVECLLYLIHHRVIRLSENNSADLIPYLNKLEEAYIILKSI
jgi:hypothetical protein